MKTKKKPTYRLTVWKTILILLGIVLIGAITFVGYRSYQYKQERKTITETPKTLVKELPEEVEKEITRAPRAQTYQVPILMYHYVEYVQDKRDTIRQSLNITPDVFERQVKTLSDAGYTFLTMRELGEIIDGKRNLPDKPIALTFDDGHWDVVTDILPILKKYKAKGTVYVISDFIDSSDFMSDKQMRQVIDSEIIEIGAHTAHHVSLQDISPITLIKEIVGSKQHLEEKYDISVVSFAYPNGAFDLAAARVVENAGYSTSVSTVPGVNVSEANRYYLYRLRPGGRTGVGLLDWLEGERKKGIEKR